jgi:chitinase
VLISLGGQTCSTDDWQQLAKNVSDLVQKVATYVTSNNLNGVDIDYEDDNGFTGVYNGIQFLIDLTNGPAQALPGYIITHAPAPGYFYASDIYNNAYTQILAQTGDNISWFNCQYYNNPPYDGTPVNPPTSPPPVNPADKVSSYSTIAETTSAPKLVIGAPVGAGAAGSGYLPLDQFTSQVIGPLRQEHPGAFGGVMGWEFVWDQGGAWADGVGLALHQQRVFYVATDGNVHHVYWDPTTGMHADQWTSDGQAGTDLATLLSG